MKSLESIFNEINSIKEEGHLVFIKFDGEREKEKISVVLSLLQDGNREVIQRHGDDFYTLLNKLLEDYHKNVKTQNDC